MGAELLNADRTDGQTDMTKLIVAFRNSANAPKNGLSLGTFQRSNAQRENHLRREAVS
jgi:hypothetical protein